MSIFGRNRVIHCTQVRARCHKQHVVVQVFVEINRRQLEASQVRLLGQRIPQLLRFCIACVHGIVATILFFFVVGGDFDSLLRGEVRNDDILENSFKEILVRASLDTIHGSSQVGRGNDEVQMIEHFRILALGIQIETKWLGTTLGTRPKLCSGRSDLIRWEVVQELTNLIVEEIFEFEASPNDTVFKTHRTFIHKCSSDLLQSLCLGVGLQTC
mmetsp:Transcript_11952/g.22139  ORF Transcript_11952/g.22139 Transcript_11952/m.22139 type:complete len:214 (-) Transcript_11952:1258-1899(-)